MGQRRQHLKKRPDGRYACRYHGIWFYGKTELEALAARDQYKKTETRTVKTITVEQYASSWLPIHKRNVSTKCYNDYAKQLDALISAIGNLPIDKVTVDDAVQVYAHYDGYSSSVIHKARMLYISVFDTAIENDLCRKNPFRSKFAQPPEGYAGSHRALTADEDQLILTVPADFRLPVMVMRYAGLRRGEMLALDIDRDVDFEAGTIHVRHAVRYESNAPILADPKTEAGDRVIPLFDILRDELAGHHGLLARSATGTLMSESAFQSAWQTYINAMETRLNGCQKRWYGRRRSDRLLMQTGELPPWKEFTVKCHDLRHSYCTMLRDAGIELKLAMQWMGHADEKMILRIYDHVTDYRTSDGIQKVDEFVRSQNGSQKSLYVV